MLPEDIDRLKSFSEKKNKRSGANSLYTSSDGGIDAGFLEAKTIKHSFKTFPTVKLGNFSKIQEDEAQAIDYGLDEEIVIPKEVQVSDKAENDPFGGAPIEQAETVTVAEDDGIF